MNRYRVTFNDNGYSSSETVEADFLNVTDGVLIFTVSDTEDTLFGPAHIVAVFDSNTKWTRVNLIKEEPEPEPEPTPVKARRVRDIDGDTWEEITPDGWQWIINRFGSYRKHHTAFPRSYESLNSCYGTLTEIE